MDTRFYLMAMYDALGEFRALEAAGRVQTFADAIGPYERYIAAIDALQPPDHLAGAHSDIARTAQAMLAFCGDPAAQRRVEQGTRPEELEAAVQPAATAYRRLQSEADQLGLTGLWFA